MRGIRAGIGGFVLLAGLGLQAAEPAAPLENSKQELKALRKGQMDQGIDAPAGNVRDVMPLLRTPASPAMPVEPPAPQKSDSTQEMAAQKNWLLDGVARLKREDESKRDVYSKNSDEERIQLRPGQNGPNDLLHLYERQQRTANSGAQANHSPSDRKDPLTPFLQEWLADSPVRGRFFDAFVKRQNSGAGSGNQTNNGLRDFAVAPALTSPDLIGPELSQRSGGPSPMRSNPYLQGLDLSTTHQAMDSSRQVAGPIAAAPVPASLATPAPAPVPQDERKRQFSTVSDDEKYFPQLKKF